MNAEDSEILREALTELEGHGVRCRQTRRVNGIDLARGGATHRFHTIVRATVRPSTVALVAEQARSVVDFRPIIVARHISRETGELLRQRGLVYADAAGNAFIDTPDFLISVCGRRSDSVLPSTAHDRVGAAAWQVAFVLLRDADAAELNVRTLGERAGVSHGAAATALHAFDARGWVRNLGRRGHPVVQPEALLSSWLTGFVDHIAPRIELGRATSHGSTPLEWARALPSATRALLGGELAADIDGREIRAATASIYVPAWDAATLRTLRLAPTPTGPIAVRRRFAPELADPSDARLVDPLIVLAEITAIPDERLDATRKRLRDVVLKRIPA